MNQFDITIADCELYFCPIETRVPLKFGPEITTHVISARAHVQVRDQQGRHAFGWGETPLSVAWVWPGTLSYSYRQERLQAFAATLRDAWKQISYSGHPMEIGHRFIEHDLKEIWEQENSSFEAPFKMPWLAALVCNSLFDIALYDAYGLLHGIDAWQSVAKPYMNHDLSWFYTDEYRSLYEGRYPLDYLVPKETVADTLVAWHLVGAKDAIGRDSFDGKVVDDGYPFFLDEWIQTDGLTCLKVKLTGDDTVWDYRRLIEVGELALEMGVEWLSADFNCTVLNPAYVTDILDRLLAEHPRIFALILYVEQPFPYDIYQHPIDVHAVSARKPLFMDESAHDWHHLAYGQKLGWNGVALKTCKTLTGALLSLCWAKEHGMTLMVQDLTNPMLAQIPHVMLAARAGTIMGVETNAMQFYPEISSNEARIHPKLFKRKDGRVSIETLGGLGMGYRIDEIEEARREAQAESLWQRA